MSKAIITLAIVLNSILAFAGAAIDVANQNSIQLLVNKKMSLYAAYFRIQGVNGQELIANCNHQQIEETFDYNSISFGSQTATSARLQNSNTCTKLNFNMISIVPNNDLVDVTVIDGDINKLISKNQVIIQANCVVENKTKTDQSYFNLKTWTQPTLQLLKCSLPNSAGTLYYQILD